MERLEDPATPSHQLDGIEAEWFPPRDLHTGDRLGFDMAAFLRLRSGERLLVSVEVKYVDTFSAKKLEYKGYTDYVKRGGAGSGGLPRHRRERWQSVALWSHENFLDVCAVQPALTDWAARMRARYVLAGDQSDR